MAPDHLLGLGFEYLISMTSNGVGGGSFEELVWVNALNSRHNFEHLYHVISSSAVVSGNPHKVGPLILVLVWLLSSGLVLLPVDPAYSGSPR